MDIYLCKICSKIISGLGVSSLCKSCVRLGKPSCMLGKKHSKKTIQKMTEIKLGKKHTQKSKDKMSKAKTGKKLKPFTKEHKENISKAKTIHGLSRFPYPLEFRFIRELIIDRDNHRCQNCGLTQEEHYKKWNKDLEIHHIDYNKFNCNEYNLITLCKLCNLNANKDRDYWYAYFTYILKNREDLC
jgi:hypothetical protein